MLLWWKVVDSNHRSHRRQIYSLEQPRRIPEVFGVVPLVFPCLLNKNSPSESRHNTSFQRGFALLLHRFRQLLHELLAVLVPQQILDGLFFQAGNLLHSVDGVLHSLTDM